MPGLFVALSVVAFLAMVATNAASKTVSPAKAPTPGSGEAGVRIGPGESWLLTISITTTEAKIDRAAFEKAFRSLTGEDVKTFNWVDDKTAQIGIVASKDYGKVYVGQKLAVGPATATVVQAMKIPAVV